MSDATPTAAAPADGRTLADAAPQTVRVRIAAFDMDEGSLCLLAYNPDQMAGLYMSRPYTLVAADEPKVLPLLRPSPASPWVAVTERMPEIGERVLMAWPTATGRYAWCGATWWGGDWEDDRRQRFPAEDVTHWQPIVAPPAREPENRKDVTT